MILKFSIKQHKIFSKKSGEDQNLNSIISSASKYYVTEILDKSDQLQVGDSDKPKSAVSNDYENSSYGMDQINASYHAPQTFQSQPNEDSFNCANTQVQESFDVLSEFDGSKQPESLNNNSAFVINDNISLQTGQNIDDYASYLNQFSVKPCSVSSKRTHQETQNIHTYSKSSCHNDDNTSSTFSTTNPKTHGSFVGINTLKSMFFEVLNSIQKVLLNFY